MTVRSRIRTRFDAGRLRELIKGPGSDTRTWLFYGRVDDDDDAVRWEREIGWVVDVTIVGGALDGEGPIPCRVGWLYAGDEAGSSSPVERGTLCACLLPEADINGTPTIVGVVSTTERPVPTEVNGQTVDEDFAKGTHFLRSPHNVEVQVGSLWRTSAEDDAKLLAQNVSLADDSAGQSYVRGEDQLDALDDLIDALDAFAQSLATAVPAPPNGALTVASTAAAYATLAPALIAAKTALQGALSSRIKGE